MLFAVMVNAKRRNLRSFLNIGLILFSLVFIQHQMGLHKWEGEWINSTFVYLFRAKTKGGESSTEDAWEALVYGALWQGFHGDRQTVHVHFKVVVLRKMGSSTKGKLKRGRVCKVLDLKAMSVTNWLLIGTPVIALETSNCSKKHLLLALNKFWT